MNLREVGRIPVGLRILVLAAALYAFFVSIALLGEGFRMLGGGFARSLLSVTATPLAGLFVGLLATSVVQSSSSTTSLLVSLIAAGTIGIERAIPIVMGANIGTTITNTIVSFVHVGRRHEFERAFPAAVVHDIFNVLAVAVLLPVEIAFHPLALVSGRLVGLFEGVGGLSLANPLKYITAPLVDPLALALTHLPWLLIVIALLLLFGALKILVDVARSVVSRRLELALDRYVFGRATMAFAVGLVFTAVVQSSSVTTSLVIPLAGAGVLTLRQLFPYTLGANVGTTVTAMLASLVTGSPAAVQLALVHTLFNVAGTAIWFPLRVVPLRLAVWWGTFCARRRAWAILYVVIIFFLVPLLVVLLTRR